MPEITFYSYGGLFINNRQPKHLKKHYYSPASNKMGKQSLLLVLVSIHAIVETSIRQSCIVKGQLDVMHPDGIKTSLLCSRLSAHSTGYLNVSFIHMRVISASFVLHSQTFAWVSSQSKLFVDWDYCYVNNNHIWVKGVLQAVGVCPPNGWLGSQYIYHTHISHCKAPNARYGLWPVLKKVC